MSRETMQSLMECAAGCRSRKHGLELNMAVMRGSTQEAKKYMSLCSNCHYSRDEYGRTPLYMAASIGKCDLIDWIITSGKSDPNAKDLESGWTALHRGAFFGELTAMRLLLRHPRINAASIDKEGCSPFDLLQRDLPRYVSYTTIGDGDVYSWGDDVNFILGTEAVKKTPELVEYFAREHISVRKVLYSKFHAVFLSSCGRVFSCGHGLGGRLGTGKQRTLLSITPIPLATSSAPVVDVALGDDHTVLLTEAGTVLTCGQNVYGQLGQSNVGEQEEGRYTEPRPVKLKGGKAGEEKVICVAAAKYHTVFGTASGVFTCGLNGGQLGHPQGERLQPRPRLAAGPSGTHRPVIVAASVGATVVYTKSHDIFALHKYECKKVARWSGVRQICVSGGFLDPSVHSSSGNTALTTGGADPLIIAVLQDQGSDFNIALWQAACPGGFRRVRWSGPCRVVNPIGAALSPTTLGLVTAAGEAFLAPLSSLRTTGPTSGRESLALVDRDEVCELTPKRVPLIHRGIHIAFDRKGKNFAVVQASPGTCITKIPFVEESSIVTDVGSLLETGDHHDIIVKVECVEVPSHKFILAASSDVFKALFTKPDYQPADFIRYERSDALEVVTLDCPGLSSLAAECLLEFFYRDTCRLLSVGFPIPVAAGASQTSPNHAETKDKRKRKKKKDSSALAAAVRRASTGDGWGGDPIRALADLAKRLGMRRLMEALSKVCVRNNTVELVGTETIAKTTLRWSRNAESPLCDAVILSEDGVRFPANKCLLSARMDYFKMMFAHSWQESSEVAPITLRLPSDIVSLILEFIYTDRIDSAQGDQDNAELLCGALAAAEVYQSRRLKDLCEELLAARLTLRNVAGILEVADFYNASQIVLACHDFMLVNAAALLEARLLESLPDPLMDDFTAYYKREIMRRNRRGRPVADWPHPSLEHLQLVDRSIDFPTLQEDEEGGEAPALSLSLPTSQRRRKRPQRPPHAQQRSFSISSEESVEIVQSPETKEEWTLGEEEFPSMEEPPKEEEEEKGTTPAVSKPRRTKFKAMSQKERRKLQQREEVADPEPQPQRKTAACPWTAPGASPGAPVSLREVMKSQEAVKEAKPRPAPIVVPPKPRKSSGNPWGDPTSPSAASKFSTIVKEQANLDATAARQASRPFELIQVEERALQELRAIALKSALRGEMNVRVEFVRSAAEPPIWKAKA